MSKEWDDSKQKQNDKQTCLSLNKKLNKSVVNFKITDASQV